MRSNRLTTLHTVFLALVSGAAIACASPAGAADPQAELSITFDDSFKGQFANAFPVMQKYGLTGTAYVITRDIGGATEDPIWTQMSWDDIRALKDAGWEIGSHTVSHPHLPTLDDKRLADELRFSSLQIARQLGQAPTSFAAPYGEVDARVTAAISKVYQNAATTGDEGGGDGINEPGKIDKYGISRLVITRNTLPEEACEAVDDAAAKKVWLVLAFHQVVDNPPTTPAGDYMVKTSDFAQIMKCISDHVHAGQLKVTNVSDALAALQPSLTAKADVAPAQAR
jgi:peptidoglycan/xylan/chitin deacetylase (PgdA/CDA1 family)